MGGYRTNPSNGRVDKQSILWCLSLAGQRPLPPTPAHWFSPLVFLRSPFRMVAIHNEWRKQWCWVPYRVYVYSTVESTFIYPPGFQWLWFCYSDRVLFPLLSLPHKDSPRNCNLMMIIWQLILTEDLLCARWPAKVVTHTVFISHSREKLRSKQAGRRIWTCFVLEWDSVLLLANQACFLDKIPRWLSWKSAAPSPSIPHSLGCCSLIKQTADWFGWCVQWGGWKPCACT